MPDIQLPSVAPYIERVEFLKSRIASAPIGSMERTAILTEIIKIRKLIRAIHDLEPQTETTPI